jgi:hypothetical protein
MADNAPSAPIVITPQETILDPNRPAGAPVQPGRSAVDIASEAARAALASKGTAVPAEQPREPNGQFAEQPKREVPQPVAPEAGQTPPAGEQPAPEGEAPPAGEGAPDGEEEVVETPEEKTARELEERTVTLKGRNDAEFDFVAPDKETADVLRQLRNSTMRSEEIAQARAEIEQRGQEIETLRSVVEMDPAGFVLEAGQQNPEVIDHLVLYLATRPEVFQRLGSQLQQIVTNAQQRELVAARQENRRLTMEREVAQQSEERAAVRQNLEDVRNTVMSLIPGTLDESRTAILFRDCLRDLRDYANTHGLQTLPTRDIPTLLATRLTAYGINPVEAAARAAEAATRRGVAPGGRPTPKGPRVPATPPAPPAVRQPSGRELVLSAKRKGAAALPPGGAGSPPAVTPMTPPKNADGSPMTIDQRVAWHRQQVAAGSKRL